jgi:hypothetical protein
MGASQMGDTKIYDFGGVVLHDEDVAWLNIAVNEAALVCRLQSAANLCGYRNSAFHRQP